MTRTNELADLLSAASLLLTLITFLYGLLYPELSRASSITLGGRHPDDVGPDRMRVKGARLRAWFLIVAATVVGAVFTPSAIDLIWDLVTRVSDARSAFDDYNPIATTLVIVTTGFFLIAAHAALMITRLTRALGRLSARKARP